MVALRNIKDYTHVTTFSEAFSALDAKKGHGMIVAGGTSLSFTRPPARINSLIDITGLNLDFIVEKHHNLHLGATVSINAIAKDETCGRVLDGVLQKAALAVAGSPTRNLITLGGNCIGQFSWSIFPVLLTALNAVFIVVSPAGKRKISSTDFLVIHPGKLIAANEIVSEIHVPVPSSQDLLHYYYFKKMSRTATEFSLATIATCVVLHRKSRKIKETRVVMGSLRPLPQEMSETQKFLRGKMIEPEVVEEACRLLQGEAAISRDIRCSAAYKREMAGILLRESLEDARARAKREPV